MTKALLNIQKKAISVMVVAVLIAVVPASTVLASGSWGYVGPRAFSGPSLLAGGSSNPSIELVGSTSYVAYHDTDGGGIGGTVMKFNGTSWETVGPVGFVQGVAQLAVDGSIPYAVYSDNTVGGNVSVKRFNGTSWEYVGMPGFSAVSVGSRLSIALDGSTPYVAYGDNAEGGKVSVKRFNGTSWDTVGMPGFSTTTIDFAIHLALDGSTPYVAYVDENEFKVIVMKFNGTSWETVGGDPASLDYSYRFDFALDNGVPYVGYADMENKLTVTKFNGNTWEMVGEAQFGQSEEEYADFSLAVSGSTPYVAYPDKELYGGGNYFATLKRFNGASWETIGTTGFVDGAFMGYGSLAVNGSTPYLAFADIGEFGGSKVSVMKFTNDPTLLTNAENGKAITLALPESAILTCGDTLKEDTVNPDSEHDYPLGLVDFCFTTDDTDNQITLVFETSLQPNQVIARKYNSVTHEYSNVPGASITSTTYNGQPALQLTYTITDNSELDQDGNIGSIQDPVGLVLANASDMADVPGAPNTGFERQNTATPFTIAGLAILAIFALIMRHKRHA